MKIEVIVPVRDSAHLLPSCLAAIQQQTLAPVRIHLSIGPSRDATAEVARSSADADRRVTLHDNPPGDRASGLNVAIAALDPTTDAVAMVDAQSRLASDYLERAAAALVSTDAAVVGGPMRPVGHGLIGRAIAAALSSPAGVGDSSFHFEGRSGEAESVYLGVYRRSALDAVGPYDPSLLRTEDDDMNARIRAAGGHILLDPSIRSTYLGRQTLGALFRQYRGYGHSKVALAAVRPGAIRARHLVPAMLVAAFVGTGVVSVLSWWPALPLMAIAYGGALLLVGLATPDLPVASRVVMAGALACMHLGYGVGSWQAVLTGAWLR